MTGALITVLIVALHALLALRPPLPRYSTPFNLQFAFGWWINEIPGFGLYWLLSSTTAVLQLRADSPVWWMVVVIGLLDVAVLVQLGLRMRFARAVLTAALAEAFGPGRAPRYSRPVWWRVLLAPFISWRPDVRRIANRQYGPGRGRRIDLYVSRRAQAISRSGRSGWSGRSREPRAEAPVLLYLHPGGFRIGNKMLGGKPLLYRLAAQGWVVASADYRLFRADYADQLADTRAALAWLRENAGVHGGDPEEVFLAGGSAGAHLAATVALGGDEVAGVIGFYGYYGSVGPLPGRRSPQQCLNPAAPPFLIVHGEVDTLVRYEDARAFAEDLRAVSRQPVAYAEVPGMHHNFDFFQSPRFSAVMDTVERFAELVLARRARIEAVLDDKALHHDRPAGRPLAAALPANDGSGEADVEVGGSTSAIHPATSWVSGPSGSGKG